MSGGGAIAAVRNGDTSRHITERTFKKKRDMDLGIEGSTWVCAAILNILFGRFVEEDVD